MERKIIIKAGQVEVAAELNSSMTDRAIWEALPLRGQVSLWGEEIYFSTPLKLELEAGREVVSIGDLGYWPTGQAFCIFFGQTPMSSPGKIVPASAVNIIGKVLGNPDDFKSVMGENEVILEAVDDSF